MKRKDVLRVLFLICLILTVETILARGGGGGGHGGGGSHGGSGGGFGGHGGGVSHGSGYENHGILDYIIFIGFIVFGLFTSITTTLLLWKSNFSKKILCRIIVSDSFWDFDELKLNARRTFYSIQSAWENRDIERVKDCITPGLYEKYKVMLGDMTERHEKNIIGNIDITETKIIGCEDYKDDSKDRYIAYIKGNILDYTIHDSTGEILKNPDKTIEKFSDTYHFVRGKKNWILEDIDNSVSLLDIVTARNYKE